MDTKTFVEAPVVEEVKTSRLPAGSTLLVNGIHVPHPEAEPNLPGAGDTRLGDTKAVTESVKITGEGKDTVAKLVSEPLHDSVKPKVVTVADSGAANPTSEDKQLVVEKETLAKTE